MSDPTTPQNPSPDIGVAHGRDATIRFEARRCIHSRHCVLGWLAAGRRQPGNLLGGTGLTIDRVQETWLCRCGHSQNKPFCDGTRRKVGFKAD